MGTSVTVKGFDFGINQQVKSLDLVFSHCFLQAWQQAGQRVLYDVYVNGQRIANCGGHTVTVDMDEAGALIHTVYQCAMAAAAATQVRIDLVDLEYVEFVLVI